MHIKVVLVEPRYQINIGYAARVAMNFGISKIAIVNPKCNHMGSNAIKYSKHASALLKNAEIYSSIQKAAKGTVLIGTTGIWNKAEGFYNIYQLDEIADKIKQLDSVSLLIGREGTGLTKDELKKCTLNIFIAANDKYKVLNTSHSLAIILYELTKNSIKGAINKNIYATSKEYSEFLVLFNKYLKKSTYIRDKKSVALAMDHIIKRAYVTKKEIKTLMAAFHYEK